MNRFSSSETARWTKINLQVGIFEGPTCGKQKKSVTEDEWPKELN